MDITSYEKIRFFIIEEDNSFYFISSQVSALKLVNICKDISTIEYHFGFSN